MATVQQAARAMKAFRAGVPLAVLRGLRKGMPLAVRLIQKEFMERKDNRHPIEAFDPPNPPPGPLGIRQGNLVRTVKVGPMRFTGRRVIASIRAGDDEVRYAAIHEYGGEILATNGPYLVFPMPLPNTGYRIVRTPKVFIPARPFLRPGVDAAMPDIIERVQRELRTLARATLRGVARFK